MLPRVATPYDQNPARIRLIVQESKEKKTRPSLGLLIAMPLAFFLAVSSLAVITTF